MPTKVCRVLENGSIIGEKNLVKAKRMVWTILKSTYCHTEKSAFDFYDIPSEYFRKSFGYTKANGYNATLLPLMQLGIIERVDSYSTTNHQCRKYRINPEMLDCDTREAFTFEQKVEVDEDIRTAWTKKVLSEAVLCPATAQRIIDDYVGNEKFMANTLVGDAALDFVSDKGIVQVSFKKENGEWGNYFCGLEKCRKNIEKAGGDATLIKHGERFVIQSLSQWRKMKAQQIRFAYEQSVADFLCKPIYAKRNETNNRLDHNFTNLPSILLEAVIIDGEKLASVDLSNSQMAFLADELTKNAKKTFFLENNKGKEGIDSTIGYKGKEDNKVLKTLDVVKGDVSSFIKNVKEGFLYESLMEISGETNRSMAKVGVFQILFSKHRAKFKAKTNFRKVYPTVLDFVDKFKAKYGDNQLAIHLQKRESEVFVDKIFPIIAQLGIKAITKHDSVLCKASEVEYVKQIVSSVLMDEIGDHHLKVHFY